MPALATVPLLLVEDDQTDALILQRALRELSFSNPIFTVASASAAIAYLEGKYGGEFPLPYIVLLDLDMPEAASVLRFIRQTLSLSHLFVVVMASGEVDRAAATANQLGADSYVIKPADDNVDDLLHLLRKHWLILDRIIEFRREMANMPLFQD